MESPGIISKIASIILRAEQTVLSVPTDQQQAELKDSLSSYGGKSGKSLFSWPGLRRRILSIPIHEVTVSRRGFRGKDPIVQQRLEQIGATFLRGYHAALDHNDVESLAKYLDSLETESKGFAFEGAAMALSLLDCLTPWKRDRLQIFLKGPGSAHAYMVHVGAGWAFARIPWATKQMFGRLDPLLRWLALDGLGFHEGYFHWQRYIDDLATPKHLSGYASRAFDQGLGRSLWFIDGGDVELIPSTISTFPQHRQADLWSGIGIACAYAGGVDFQSLKRLREAAGSYWPCLAQGVAFAAKARQHANIPAVHTDMASEVVCGLRADAAAEITDIALQGLSAHGEEPEYEVWRSRIRDRFAS